MRRQFLNVAWRRALDTPSAVWKTPGRIASKWRSATAQTRPRVVIFTGKERHPDHYTCSVLGYEACFLAGLSKLDPQGVLSNRLAVGEQGGYEARATSSL